MNAHRRTLIKLLAGWPLVGASGLLAAPPLWAQPTGRSIPGADASEKPNFVLVFLRGAADTLSMLVPYNDPSYYAKRPTLAIPRQDCLPLTASFGVHPALKDSFHDLYQRGNAVFVPMGGQEDTTRSHFESQNTFEGGLGTISHSSGFMGRLTEVLGCRTVSFTENLPVVCASPRVVVPNKTFNPINVQLSPEEINDLARQYQQDSRLGQLFAASQQAGMGASAGPMDGSSTTLDKAAVFMRTNRTTLAFMEILNWDTHAHEGAIGHGKLPDLLTTLNAELRAFHQAATPAQWNNTVIMVATEFGRKVQENGTGTDHGHGSVLGFFGGAITQARIAGDWLPLTDNNLFEGRDVTMAYDYRDVLTGVFGKLYGLTPSQLDHVFPGRRSSGLVIV